MSNYEMPDLTGASCAGTDLNAFYHEQVVEVVVEVPIGNKSYDMIKSNPKVQYNYLRRMCLQCPVVQECREWAIVHEKHGFWGGMTPIERESERVLRGITLDEPDYYIPSGNGYNKFNKETDWEEEEEYARNMVNG